MGRITRLNVAIDRFFSQFDTLTNRVTESRGQDFARNLRSWFVCIDSAPVPLGFEISRLTTIQTWEDVQRDVMQPPRGMVGSGRLNWPDDDDLRLSGQMVLFRRLASVELDPMDFAFNYFYTGDNNITRTIQNMADMLFRPLSEDLRLRFEAIAAAREVVGDSGIPAADRIVALDHNSKGYLDVVEKIAALEEALRANNQIAPEEKGRIQAEVASGKVLLAAPRTRLTAIKEVLLSPITWIAATFAGGALGEIASIALHAIAALLGFPL